VKKATIVPDGECLGSVSHFSIPPSINEDLGDDVWEGASRRWIFRALIVYHAGAIAEARGLGVKHEDVADGSGVDFGKLADFALRAWGDYQEKIDQSYQEAEKLLETHWNAVEAVAAALMEHKTLSGKRIREIVMANGGRRYLVRGGQKSVERKNRAARATIPSHGGIRIPPLDTNEVIVWHEQPMTVVVM
jgi:hypothetical protein